MENEEGGMEAESENEDKEGLSEGREGPSSTEARGQYTITGKNKMNGSSECYGSCREKDRGSRTHGDVGCE